MKFVANFTNKQTTGEITTKTTNKYTIITICNYESYQINIDDTNKQTNNQDNKQLTTTKEIKNIRNKELKEEKNKNSFSAFSAEF